MKKTKKKIRNLFTITKRDTEFEYVKFTKSMALINPELIAKEYGKQIKDITDYIDNKLKKKARLIPVDFIKLSSFSDKEIRGITHVLYNMSKIQENLKPYLESPQDLQKSNLMFYISPATLEFFNICAEVNNDVVNQIKREKEKRDKIITECERFYQKYH